MHVEAVRQLAMENQLRKALENQELTLSYQPQVALDSGRITGVEALMRWTNPELGVIPPLDFIPIAEDTGMIFAIGDWALRTACKQARAWQKQGMPRLRMAVNLSARQCTDPQLADRVAAILAETGLEPGLLELEITESVLMKAGVLGTLTALKRLGVQLSIDDFGMGYSNLNYLRQFPIDRLKIDKAFVQDVTYQPGSDGIASAVIAMARSLQMGVIAEGVETDLQLKLFQDLECDEMQGYYFSRPYPAEQLGALLRDYFYCGAHGKRCDSRAMVSLDQDPQTLAILRRVAVHARQRLFVAQSGPEALALIADHPAAVVFWNPECCGGAEPDLPRRVRELSKEAICITLLDVDPGTAPRPGGQDPSTPDGVLVKPFSQQRLWAVLQERLGAAPDLPSGVEPS